MRVKKEMTADNVDIIAGGLALYALLAVFPALAAAVSIYGLFASPADIADHLQEVRRCCRKTPRRFCSSSCTSLRRTPMIR